MKKSLILMLALALCAALALGACSKKEDAAPAASDEPAVTQDAAAQSNDNDAVTLPETDETKPVAGDMPEAYQTIIDSYTEAIGAGDKAEALMQKELNYMVTTEYLADPAKGCGYVVRDVDGDGKSELLVASMTSGDEFCDGLVFAMYALDENDNAKLVFTSAERDRYYSVGDDLFAHVGASSADSSLETTERYENGEMTDTGEVTDPANYTPVADTVTFVK